MTNSDYQNQQGFGSFPGGPLGAGPAPVVATKKRGRRERRGRGGDAPGPRRNVSSLRWLFLLFAAAVGILGVLVTATPSATVYVARSADTIAQLTGVSASQFAFVELSPDAIEPDAISAETEAEVRTTLEAAIAGKWFLYPVSAGQQIRTSMLVASGELAIPLTADERLLSITARAANAVSGSVRPGSLVDIYVSDGEGFTGVLGQAIEIVAVSLLPEQFESAAQQQFNDPGKTLSDFVPDQPVGGTYVIRVQASDVARYIAADTAGKITLSLRGSAATTFPASPTDLRTTICGGSADPVCARDGQ